MQPLLLPQSPTKMNRYLYAIFLFIYTDFKTILIPHTLIGILQASTGPLLTTEMNPDIGAILRRTYMVLLWNGLNLLTFTITNQRLPQSIAEDSINKPCVAWTGAGPETLGLVAMAWLYNDLEGGNENVILRHGLNGCGFALYTHASTMIAANEDNSLLWILRRGHAREHVFMTPLAMHWLFIQACIVATTIHAMDLPDMEGDSKRGRRTLPLVVGEETARTPYHVDLSDLM
ncbi:UbiA prenyltransferase [Diaporthe eres]|nr:UbiA prenyltransferase [Diaporthe eres]